LQQLEQGLERVALFGCPRVKMKEETFSMNKKLMAVAVAGALTAPAWLFAQVGSSPGITLYGRLDETIVNSKYSSVSNSAGVTTTNEVKKGRHLVAWQRDRLSR